MVDIIFKGGFDNNFTYLLTSANGECAVIDPCGKCAETLKSRCIPENLLKYILITHGHNDHFDAVDEVKKLFPEAKTAGHKHAEFQKDIALDEGSSLCLGNNTIDIIHTPGHSRDSLCYIYMPDKAIFTGDTLFIGCIGFCRSPKNMAQSLDRLRTLPEELIIYSGHDYGDVPNRSLAEEKVKNPEFSPDFISKLYSERR